MKKLLLFYVVLMLFCVGCVTASKVPLNPSAKNIIISNEKPDNSYEEIGPISVTHGNFGWAKGNYEGAHNLLKNKALEMNGDYVHIVNIQDGGSTSPQALTEYKINGILYKSVKSK